jgi:predicted transcriptional regulator
MTNTPQTPYPTRLKEILDSEGRSQAWLARHLGVTRSMVCEWANRERPIAQGWHEDIAKALGRTVADVFPEQTERKAA